MARLKPTERTIKQLFALSGNQCAHPECKNLLIDPSGTVLAEICHIEAAEKEGPRFNTGQNDEDRRAFENLLLLCSIHHTLIDDQPEKYKAEELKKWKADHEEKYRNVHALTDEQIEKAIRRPEKIDLTRLPNTSATLFGREKELALLDTAWENPHTKIISLIAWGGVGKSALTNAWLNGMDEQNFKGAERVYGWSFYSQGTKEDGNASADGFLNDALQWFGYIGEPPRSQHEKGRLLAAQIAQQKTLLILDGLEPLQYPPGEMYGHLKDQAMTALLKGLARSMTALCVITSRCQVEDLRSTEGRMTMTYPLENLSAAAGRQVLKSYGIQGPDKELEQASLEFKGHALALNLLGSYLKTIHDGDIRKRDLIPKITEEEKHGGHARRVMESYERWFAENNQPELDILNLLGLFDRPATKEAIDVLKAKPAIPGLTDRLIDLTFPKWKISLEHLRELRLLAKKENLDNDTLDCHPLIREHFGEKLQRENSDAWQEAHARLYEYYKNLPEKELPDTLIEMEPLFVAVRHGCLAGKHEEAFEDIWWKRTKRTGGQQYSTRKLGAFGYDLSCLSAFFESPWERPIASFTRNNKAAILSWTGYALRAVGRLSEAVYPMKVGLEMHIENQKWENATIIANNLSELHLTLGNLQTALKYAKQSVEFADHSENHSQMEVKRASYAGVIFCAGRSKEAEDLFLKAEDMMKKRQTEFPYLRSIPGFLYSNLLISLGRYQEVLKRTRTTLNWMKSIPNVPVLTIVVDYLTLGKVLFLQSVQKKSTDFTEAADFLHQAVEGSREAGEQEFIGKGLLARASFYRHQNNFPAAWADLDEAREIAEYGEMRLHLTDYYLEACRVISRQLAVGSAQSGSYEILENGETLVLSKAGMVEKFRAFLAEAERLVAVCGYHRRDGEVEELKGIAEGL